MARALLLACACILATGRAWGFEEAASANRNLAAIIVQLETGDWNARIHAVHELEYMQSEGLPGLALATEDGDWQVRMTAVHAIGPRGVEGAPILTRLLKHEPCPVVRLMTLHNLGSLGPEGEEAKAMGWISEASNKEIACLDQPGPGRASWARGGRRSRTAAAATAAKPVRRPRRGQAPAPVFDVEEPSEEVVTRDPIPQARPAATVKPARPKEDLPSPTKFQRHIELDAM
ncbi:MAG: HEAT repeat domain-containing protein, partial [Elusimicrobiota bacterium]